MEATPNNHGDVPSKRRRLDDHPTPESTSLHRYVGTTTDSPLRHTPAHRSSDDTSIDKTQSQEDLPYTQDPTLLSSISQSTNNATSSSAEAAGDAGVDDASSEFTRILPLEEIPSQHVEIIKDAIQDVYGFSDPRPFQIEAINHLAFDVDSSLVLVRRTADGKSLVPLTVSVLRRGITLVLVPLHGLGSDQVDKATVPAHGIEAYYVDEHKFSHAKMLEQRLRAYSEEEADHNSIIIFASPNSLSSGSNWYKLFQELAKDGLIRTVAIDEAHEVEQSGRSFRKEFVVAAKSLDTLIKSMPHPVPRILMSATFTRGDYESFSKIFGMSKVNPEYCKDL